MEACFLKAGGVSAVAWVGFAARALRSLRRKRLANGPYNPNGDHAKMEQTKNTPKEESKNTNSEDATPSSSFRMSPLTAEVDYSALDYDGIELHASVAAVFDQLHAKGHGSRLPDVARFGTAQQSVHFVKTVSTQ